MARCIQTIEHLESLNSHYLLLFEFCFCCGFVKNKVPFLLSALRVNNWLGCIIGGMQGICWIFKRKCWMVLINSHIRMLFVLVCYFATLLFFIYQAPVSSEVTIVSGPLSLKRYFTQMLKLSFKKWPFYICLSLYNKQ